MNKTVLYTLYFQQYWNNDINSYINVLSPSDCHWFGRAVTGDDGDETRVVCVLEDKEESPKVSFHYFIVHLFRSHTKRGFCARRLTLRMRRMAAIPDVAMTLALLGTRFSSVGMMLSAPWSNLLPSNDDKCLKEGRTRKKRCYSASHLRKKGGEKQKKDRIKFDIYCLKKL